MNNIFTDTKSIIDNKDNNALKKAINEQYTIHEDIEKIIKKGVTLSANDIAYIKSLLVL